MRLKTALVAAVIVVAAGRMSLGAPAAPPPIPQGPAAIVNGEEIPYDEYISVLETLPPPDKSTRWQVAGARALDEVVGAKILIQFAEKEGVPVTDAQVEKQVQEIKSQGNIQAVLQSRFQTPREFRRELRGQLAYANLAVKYAGVTDSEIDDYYFKNKAKFNLPARVRVGAIITSTRQKIELAQSKLNQGADFSAVSKELSDDAITRQQGGMLGWVWPNQQGVPGSVVNTAMGLAAGSISQPIMIQNQWVILKTFERKAPEPRPIEEVRDNCREALAIDRLSRKPELKRKIVEFRKASDVQVFVKRFGKDFAAALKTGVEEVK